MTRAATPQNLVSSEGTVVHELNSLTGITGANCTLALSDDCMSGTNSVYLQSVANPATGTIDWYPSPALDISAGNNISFYFKPDANNVAFTLWVYIFDGSASHYKGVNFSANAYPTEWQRVTIGKADFTVSGTNPRWSNVTRVRLGIAPGSGVTTGVKFDLMRANTRQLPRCVLFFDDNFVSFINLVYPYLEQRGIKGNLAFVRNFLNASSGGVGGDNMMTTEQNQTLYDAGWDIVNHSENHVDWAGLTEAQRTAEIKNNEAYMISQGWNRALDMFCYSQGTYNAEYEALARELGYKAARGYTNLVNESEDWNNTKTATHSHRILVSSMQTKATFKAHVDHVQKYGGTMFGVAHDVTEGTPTGTQTSAADFYEQIEYLRSRGIKIITASEYLRQLQNPRGMVARA